MALVDDLLANGTVTQDDIDPEKVVFNVPVKIKKLAVNAQGFELFAAGTGWTPTVNVIVTDGDGNQTLVEEPNPLSVHAWCIDVTRNWVKETFEGIIRKQAQEQADAQAAAQVAALT